ncbi:ExbD/TolR family protein [Geomonas propionica]|uniref:Biopolymer transporter ExbD n=1 Tax=Geomonas propionica TaxID=2798582 RepID=A0ABS0YUC8_9BACT|nr:biopolymer transporter ExbD [Geomonas propionica]MBJ6801582.1 biopolymer transporter ExbD [Geomonas propionica]
MARRRRRQKEQQHEDIMEILNLTPMMDVFTVLVVFLLITAVFTSITIMELSVPTSAGASAATPPNFAIEVIVRKSGLEIANGKSVEAAIPKKDDKYDLEKLSEIMRRLKAQYPDKEDASVLMEPKVEYDHLVQVMDTVRGAEVRTPGSNQVARVVLFPKISIGDAP